MRPVNGAPQDFKSESYPRDVDDRIRKAECRNIIDHKALLALAVAVIDCDLLNDTHEGPFPARTEDAILQLLQPVSNVREYETNFQAILSR